MSSPISRPVAQILIKIVEGLPLEQRDTSQGPRLFWGGAPFVALQDFETSSRRLRQSFPRFVARLRAKSPDAVGPNTWTQDSLDLFLRLSFFDAADETATVLEALRQRKDAVQYAFRVIPLSERPPSAPDFETNEGFLDYGQDGIDAYYAWSIGGATTDGTGRGVGVAIVDLGYCDTHPNLPAVTLLGTNATTSSALQHGTAVVGMLGSPKTGEGTSGICPGATFLFSAADFDLSTDVHEALDRLLGFDSGGTPLLSTGDVLLLEAQLSYVAETGVFPVGGIDYIPVEANSDTLNALIRAASELGVTVVEAAGDSGAELVALSDSTGAALWDPAGTDSLAILVGAGSSTDQHRVSGNFGARVDCQGWGEDVWAPWCPDGGSADGWTEAGNQYTRSFSETSSACAMVAGLVGCLQGAYNGCRGAFLDPVQVRNLVRDGTRGSPQTGDLTQHIGPLPSLYKILSSLGVHQEIYFRRRIPETYDPPPWGPPEPPFLNHCPDLVLRPRPFVDPVRSFGLEAWGRELDSQPTSWASNYTYARVRNKGVGPDSGVVRAWWSEPSPFLHPRWWRPCNEAPMPLALLASQEVGVVCVPWSVSPGEPRQVSLIAAFVSDRAPRPIPVAEMSTMEFVEFATGKEHLGFRSVVKAPWRRRPGGEATFLCHLRGVPEGRETFTLRTWSNLPPGTKVSVATNPAPATVLYTGNTQTGAFGVVLDENEVIVLRITVVPPTGTPPGRYIATLDQWWRDTGLGRITFVVDAFGALA